MTVTLYNSSADAARLDKSGYLTLKREGVNADIKGACSVENPVLILDYNSVDFNYVYAPAFGRYYFVTDIVVNTAGRVIISCKSDVLMSFKDSIKNLSVYVSRTEAEQLRDKMSIDNSMPISADVQYEILEGTQLLQTGNTYVLGVI